MKKLIKQSATLIFTAVLSFGVQAANIVAGEKLSNLSIQELGECVLSDGDTTFQPWNTGNLLGQVHVMEYLAARAGVDDINRSFYDALKAEQIPTEQVAITKLINSDDALWGTSGLVPGEIKKNKKLLPEHRLVIDSEGLGQQQWDLNKKSAALAVLDASGKVLFFKQGGLTDAEVQSTVAMIKQQLSAGAE